MTRFDPDALRSLLTRELDSWPVDHAFAALIHDGEVVSVGDEQRSYALASVTKPIVAWGVMNAVEEEFLDLDEPLGPQGSTVKHLLTHASGVGFASVEPEKQPGERRIYSSAGFEILADHLAELSGMDFPQFLHDTVFAPLGMNDTVLEGSAGHGITSTGHDMVRFAQEVLDPQLLAPETAAAMREVYFPELDGVVPGYGMQKPCPWGLGFEVHGEKSPHWLDASMPAEVVGHFGQAGTFLWHAPKEQVAMVALTDRAFGPWAVKAWAPTNKNMWDALNN